MQCFKQQQFINDPQDSSINLTQNYLIFENSNIPNCSAINSSVSTANITAYPLLQPQEQHSPVQQHHHQSNANNNNNCDNYTQLTSPNHQNSCPSPAIATSSSPFSATLNQMPHFGLGSGPGMANNAYAQTPPSPPLHHAGGGGGGGAGGNGGLMPPSPPHLQQAHNQHQQQQQQQHHAHLAMMPRGLTGGNPGGGGGGGSIMSTGLNTSVSSLSSATSYRTHIEEKKLTREAMERYMRERNDMVIVILHAKVSHIHLIFNFFIFR